MLRLTHFARMRMGLGVALLTNAYFANDIGGGFCAYYRLLTLVPSSYATHPIPTTHVIPTTHATELTASQS